MDKTVKVWDLNVQKEKASLDGHTDLIQSMSWNLDGSAMITSCRDRVLRMYDPRTKTLLVVCDIHCKITKIL